MIISRVEGTVISGRFALRHFRIFQCIEFERHNVNQKPQLRVVNVVQFGAAHASALFHLYAFSGNVILIVVGGYDLGVEHLTAQGIGLLIQAKPHKRRGAVAGAGVFVDQTKRVVGLGVPNQLQVGRQVQVTLDVKLQVTLQFMLAAVKAKATIIPKL